MTFCSYFVPVFGQQVRKMCIIILILNEFSCGKVEKPFFLFAATEYLSVFMLHTNFLHKFEQRLSHIAQTCVEKYIMVENGSYIMTYCRNNKVSALYHVKIH